MGSDKQQKKKEVSVEAKKGMDKLVGTAVPAVIEEIVGRTGFRGEITQVMARIMQGIEKGKLIKDEERGKFVL